MSGAAESLESRELSPRQAGELVGGEGGDEVIAAAIARVADGRVAVRRNALLALSLVDPPGDDVVATADIARKDEDPVVRRHAVSIFGHQAVPVERALGALRHRGGDGRGAVQQRAQPRVRLDAPFRHQTQQAQHLDRRAALRQVVARQGGEVRVAGVEIALVALEGAGSEPREGPHP